MFTNVDNGQGKLQHAEEQKFVQEQANADLDVSMNVGDGQ